MNKEEIYKNQINCNDKTIQEYHSCSRRNHHTFCRDNLKSNLSICEAHYQKEKLQLKVYMIQQRKGVE